MKVFWTLSARADRALIFDYISTESPKSALGLDELFDEKAKLLLQSPLIGRKSRLKGLRELVVHPNYLMVYKINSDTIWIIRVLHVAQKWP